MKTKSHIVLNFYEHNRFKVVKTEEGLHKLELVMKLSETKSTKSNGENEEDKNIVEEDFCERHDDSTKDLILDDEIIEEFKELARFNKNKKIVAIKGLGLDYDFYKDLFIFSYYIGADWIDDANKYAVVVRPKLETESIRIDFQRMFMDCMNDDAISKEHSLDELFYIRPDQQYIRIKRDVFTDNIEPILIISFLEMVKKIIKNGGLRKDYIMREENLDSKIKGKLLLSNHIKKNVSVGRKHFNFCRYQDYDIDCLDNRLLKKAILQCRRIISRQSKQWGSNMTPIMQLINFCLPIFGNVSSDISKHEIKHIKINALFKYYKKAIPLAKMILDHQTIRTASSSDDEVLVPPFRIDMALLFERYVYHMLHQAYGSQVRFQVSTRSNKMDFCKKDEHMVIDAKYKPLWKEHIDHDNIRQLSGYARFMKFRNDKEILNVGDEKMICPSVIIYPDIEEGITSFVKDETLRSQCVDIDDYCSFYKVGITLPTIKN